MRGALIGFFVLTIGCTQTSRSPRHPTAQGRPTTRTSAAPIVQNDAPQATQPAPAAQRPCSRLQSCCETLASSPQVDRYRPLCRHVETAHALGDRATALCLQVLAALRSVAGNTLPTVCAEQPALAASTDALMASAVSAHSMGCPLLIQNTRSGQAENYFDFNSGHWN